MPAQLKIDRKSGITVAGHDGYAALDRRYRGVKFASIRCNWNLSPYAQSTRERYPASDIPTMEYQLCDAAHVSCCN